MGGKVLGGSCHRRAAAVLPAVTAATYARRVTRIVDGSTPHRHRAIGQAVADRQDLLLVGDAAATLVDLPRATVQTVVTSPPYWSLRDYTTDGQIGMDEPLPAFLKALVGIFAEVRRVLTDDGTVWVNLGDSYTSGNRGWRAPDRKNPARAMRSRPPTPEGLKDKDLIGVPWRFALAMQEAGWWLRADIVWYKPNCQPESVGDRPTRSHEHIFLFSKSETYRYDVDTVRRPQRPAPPRRVGDQHRRVPRCALRHLPSRAGPSMRPHRFPQSTTTCSIRSSGPAPRPSSPASRRVGSSAVR